MLARFNYQGLEDKVVRILPHSSLVGMLFSPVDSRYEVVESKTFGLFQHDPFTWLVEEDHFLKVRDIYKSRKRSDGTINEWILSLNEEQVKTFVDTLYQVISASEAETLIDFTADWKKSMTGVLTALKEVDGETKTVLKKVVRALFGMAKERMRLEWNQKARDKNS